SVKMLKNILKKGMKMKKLILAVALGLGVAMSGYAAIQVSSVRGSTEILEVGQSYNRMIDVLGRPESSKDHVVRDRRGWPYAATSYFYTIGTVKYEVTVIDKVVFSISWER
ncbi:hypothetical protein ABFO59_15090, partial [Acinetobacter radioresistens]|uniref:hypothetical protein n=1 Tax=Acinetobacter radioresistens TaxID=40216 RepID=UPI003212658E